MTDQPGKIQDKGLRDAEDLVSTSPRTGSAIKKLRRGSRTSHKEVVNQNDAFLSTAGKGVAWVEHHNRWIILALVGIATIAAVTWGIHTTQVSEDVRASELFEKARKILGAQVAAEGETAAPTANPPTFATERERDQAARDAFDRARKDGASSGVANLARLYMASIDMRLGKFDEARAEYLSVRREMGPSDSLAFVAAEGLAYAYEAGGNFDEALKVFESYERESPGFYKDYAIFHQGRLFALKGDTVRARQLFERIATAYPESPMVSKARERLAMLPAEGAPVAQAAAAQPPAQPVVEPIAAKPQAEPLAKPDAAQPASAPAKAAQQP